MTQYVLPTRKKRKLLIVSAVLVVLVAGVFALYRTGSLAALGRSEPEPTTVVVSLPAAARVSHTLLADYDGTPSWSVVAESLRFPGLLRPNADMQLTPFLADSFNVDGDGKTVSFTLSEKAVWRLNDEEQTQRPVTSADVAATWQLVLKLEPQLADAVTGVEKPSPTRIVLRLTTVSPAVFWRLATIGILPADQIEGVTTREQLDNLDVWQSALSAGPYFLAGDASTDSSWTFNAEPEFMGTTPQVDRMVLQFEPTLQADVAVLDVNQQDATTGALEQPLAEAGYAKIVTPQPTYVSVALNMGRGPAKNNDVRRALSLATDRNRLIDGVLKGNGLPAWGPFMPETWAASGQNTASYDPEKARQLLATAGYADTNGDGFLEDASGHTLQFELLVPAGIGDLESTSELLIGMWQEIGVQARTEKLQSEVFLKRVFLDRSFDGFIFMWPVTADPDPSVLWRREENRRGGINPVGFVPPRVDALLDAGQSTLVYKKRQEVYGELANLVQEELPHLFLYWPGDVTMVHPDLEGVKPAIRGTSWDVTEWFWREPTSR